MKVREPKELDPKNRQETCKYVCLGKSFIFFFFLSPHSSYYFFQRRYASKRAILTG